MIPKYESIERLISLSDPYNLNEGNEVLFFDAMRDCTDFHYNNCQYYKNLCNYKNFTPSQLSFSEDLKKIPHLYVKLFKKYRLLSIKEEEIHLNFTSSGTEGEKSQIFFDRDSLERGLRMVESCFNGMNLVKKTEKTNYILFTYEPHPDNKFGTSYTDDSLTHLTDITEKYFALQWDKSKNDYTFNQKGTLEKMREFEASPFPTRFIGFPSFLFFLLDNDMKSGKRAFNFGTNSYVLTGGGWKKHSDQKVNKKEFLNFISDRLSIPSENLRDSFGMVEHGVPYIECEEHNLHVPTYARAYIRDVESLKFLPFGHEGLLQLTSPFNLAVPSHSILTSDLAIMGDFCTCGCNTPYFNIIGRSSATVKTKGCALSAEEKFLK